MVPQGLPPRPDGFELLRNPYTLFQLVVGLVALVALILAILSSWWTSYHEGRILRRALGRKVREEDQTSLKTWMGLRGDQIAEAERELARNPFEGPLDALETIGERIAPPPKDDQ